MMNPSLDEVDSTMANKCLDICQALTSQGKTFNFTLKIGSSFNFSLDTRVKNTSLEIVKKKLSPSSIRRNARRKDEFLKRKAEVLKTTEVNADMEKSSQDVKTHQCDVCDIKAINKTSLRQHMEKEHSVIPQFDGLNDVEAHEEKSSQTKIVIVKEAGVQTETSDTGVAVKWGNSKEVTLPPGTVVLKYEEAELKEVPVDYPVMSSPATWVYHPFWGLGNYHENYEERFIYKFKGNGIHTGGIMET